MTKWIGIPNDILKKKEQYFNIIKRDNIQAGYVITGNTLSVN